MPYNLILNLFLLLIIIVSIFYKNIRLSVILTIIFLLFANYINNTQITELLTTKQTLTEYYKNSKKRTQYTLINPDSPVGKAIDFT